MQSVLPAQPGNDRQFGPDPAAKAAAIQPVDSQHAAGTESGTHNEWRRRDGRQRIAAVSVHPEQLRKSKKRGPN